MREAIAIDAAPAAFHYLLGSALFDLGQFSEARSALEDCLARSPRGVLALHAKMRLAHARAKGTELPKYMDFPTSRHVSILICSIDDGKFGAVATRYRQLFEGIAHEIVRIPDARSLCDGYNRGIAAATGDVIVFSHDDVDIVSDDFAGRLLRHLRRRTMTIERTGFGMCC